MPNPYDPSLIEPKWQKKWEEAGVYVVDLAKAKKPHYCLVMFPYPSGARLHVGHWYQYGPTDSYARFLKMRGHDVFFPMGFDAFGLPAENYAVKTGVSPARSTEENIRNMVAQFRRMGCMYDWSKALNTSDPSYYRWTQWLFLQMFEHGLAYKKEAPVNFCPQCRTVLAREQCQDGLCERCEAQVVQRPLTQWFWKLTQYAERLLVGLDNLDWPKKTKIMQWNWIGKSQGATVKFQIPNAKFQTNSKFKVLKHKKSHEKGVMVSPSNHDTVENCQYAPFFDELRMTHKNPLDSPKNYVVEVFTTRPDTLFGATYLVLAPEHPLVPVITTREQCGHIEAYVAATKTKNELQRTDLAKEKTGVFTGAYALHPATGEPLPVWVADYVLPTYGTGAVMAVPAHDERDHAFAKKYGLPVKVVVAPEECHSACHAEPVEARHAGAMVRRAHHDTCAFTADGVCVNSAFLTGLKTSEAKKRIVAWLEDEERGREVTTYRLHDWLVSRQRYWGAPIPIVYDPDGNPHPIPEKHLPWLLPTDVAFKPTGESPLGNSKEFKERTEKIFGKGWRPEYDTMDTFVCSSFYYLRFLTACHAELVEARHAGAMVRRAHHDTHFVDPSIEKKWLPVSTYIGGPEHACMHLIYARFVTMALKDFGFVSHDEPFKKLVHQGLITNKGAKMSKSKGNVVDPDPLVAQYGSDVFRMYLMFMGPYTDGGDWSETGIKGIERFVQRIWKLFAERAALRRAQGDTLTECQEVMRKLHETIKRVTEDLEQFHFNTAISALMELLNVLERQKRVSPEVLKIFTTLLAPLAPHLAEELWEILRGKCCERKPTCHGEPVEPSLGSQFACEQPWPSYDPKLLVAHTLTIVVQVNGKVRANIEVPADAAKEDILAAAKKQENIAKYVEGRAVKKEVYVPGKLINIVL